ncbi:hypothetical protein [Thioclava pacifica]|uniref:Uncharacterized protein n=1 Tax=Thioclava pacifica DSM 10166 TaxID=1353537 RepID=A0A074J5C8_9RHOB|nr:hypothetical protein [Thioclava pacifica]KEO51729.1 hypothetical protein TP2_09630 [Thioclava pacifica DSM 10166]
MLLDTAIFLLALIVLGSMYLPKLRKLPRWRAMVTPLASIIGSGFLVLGPILEVRFGAFAPLAMASLCIAAWLFGAAVRRNIASETQTGTPLTARIEALSQIALAFAYVISVTYYLNLFGAFAVSLTPWNSHVTARIVTTSMLALVAITGFTGGFRALERMEYASLSLNLAIIAGLLLGLAVYFGKTAVAGALVIDAPTLGTWDAVRLLFGLIVIVQGFETARYLGASYDPPSRIAAMKWAQLMSSAIYMVYILLLAYIFAPNAHDLTETAIIDMMRVVSPILPAMLVATALAAQFSAAVADTEGAGGLVSEFSRGRIAPKLAYPVLIAAGITLTWTTDLFAIISYASRAFAGYYALQAALAAIRSTGPKRYAFVALTGLGVAMTLLGTPAESG